MNSAASAPFPWRLRLEHEGQMSLRVERQGRWLRFDPSTPPDGDDIVVLTWCWPDHLEATAASVSAGKRPTVIAPGPVETDMTAALGDERMQSIIAAVPLERAAAPDEIAAAVTFLASPEAGYITGAVLPVDGGLGMGH